jgi:hypothetical protein
MDQVEVLVITASDSHRGLQGVLDWAFPYHPVVDVIRVGVLAMAVILILWLVRVGITRPGPHSDSSIPRDPYPLFTKWCFTSMALGAFFAILQELAVLGEPLLWWRVPLIAAMLATAWKAMTCRL